MKIDFLTQSEIGYPNSDWPPIANALDITRSSQTTKIPMSMSCPKANSVICIIKLKSSNQITITPKFMDE